ncbi:hypothetical protein BD769DRAFT_1458497 [Suillus cothurnatus]|nr:hypothetical protein BD769DRAFT_1458497 [Suillus cothurnatus]
MKNSQSMVCIFSAIFAQIPANVCSLQLMHSTSYKGQPRQNCVLPSEVSTGITGIQYISRMLTSHLYHTVRGHYRDQLQ